MLPDDEFFVYFISDYSYNWVEADCSSGDFRAFSAICTRTKDTTTEEQEQDDVPTESRAYLYTCHQEGCTKIFHRLGNLERHLSLEKCERVEERRSLMDLAKLEYAKLLEEGVGTIPTLSATTTSDGMPTHRKLDEGWSLKKTAKSYRFNEKQRNYLLAKFNIGAITGRKANPDAVAKEMRRSIGPDGKRLFLVTEFLSAQQIKSFFARQAAKQSSTTSQPQTENDIVAQQEENNFSSAQLEVLSHLQAEHPVVYDHYNICELSHANMLSQLKLPVLKLICQELELQCNSDQDSRRKATYISLLQEMVNDCTCSSPS